MSKQADNKILGWEDYPQPRVVTIRNKLSIEVSIPRSIRHLFGNGNGKTNNVRLTTGTSDPAIANTKKWTLTHEIYQRFDDKQAEAERENLQKTDNFALDVILAIAKSFQYNRGDIPELNADTDHADLIKLRATVDGYVQMMTDQAPPQEALASYFEALTAALQNGVDPLTARQHAEEVAGPMGPFTMEQNALLSKHTSKMVQSYWEDLLTSSAVLQGVMPPQLEDRPSGIDLAEKNGDYLPNLGLTGWEPVQRPRRVKPAEAMSVSDVQEEYFAYVATRYDKINTRRKWTRTLYRFVEHMGDLPLTQIKPLTGYRFAEKQVGVNPAVSNANITDYHTGMSLMLKYCVRKGYIEVNPFQGVSVKEYGKSSQSWQAYTLSELEQIFEYEWRPQERLLLSIIATTGMRATEVGSLTWERFNDSEVAGVRYFTLIGTDDEEVVVKNEGSARHVPLHPNLLLPQKGEGRLFDYTIDDNGLCSSSIGHIINPALNSLIPHKRKSTHSFRRTLKVMLRDAGVSKEVNDIYTGHGSGDIAGSAYGGASVKTRFDAISKLKLPWLKQS